MSSISAAFYRLMNNPQRWVILIPAVFEVLMYIIPIADHYFFITYSYDSAYVTLLMMKY